MPRAPGARPTDVLQPFIAEALLVSLGVGVFFGFCPTRKAARLDMMF